MWTIPNNLATPASPPRLPLPTIAARLTLRRGSTATATPMCNRWDLAYPRGRIRRFLEVIVGHNALRRRLCQHARDSSAFRILEADHGVILEAMSELYPMVPGRVKWKLPSSRDLHVALSSGSISPALYPLAQLPTTSPYM